MMIRYKHTQFGTFLVITYTIIILILGYISVTTGFKPIPVAVLLLMIVMLAIFASLTVIVTDRTLAIRFGLPLVSRSFRLRDIKEVQAVENPWYYMLGIRYTPRGWLYAVSGSSAVEIQMNSGRRYRIGTDDPHRLTSILKETMVASSTPG